MVEDRDEALDREDKEHDHRDRRATTQSRGAAALEPDASSPTKSIGASAIRFRSTSRSEYREAKIPTSSTNQTESDDGDREVGADARVAARRA